MRKNKIKVPKKDFKIIAVDDEIGILDSLSIQLQRYGYEITPVTDPLEAIELVRNEHFDLMILDFMMKPIHGDAVVEKIREFNKTLYILLLTGYKDLAPPLETIQKLDIQGYSEKSDKFDQLLLLIESAVKSVMQMREITKMNTEILDINKKLEASYIQSIELLRSTVDAKDIYTGGHSDRVSEYAELIGKKLNLSEKDINTLKIGALFHDIGKIGITDAIIRKKSGLTDEEYDLIKSHPNIGYDILSKSTLFNDVIPIVKHHHERYDGTGYPDKLKGDAIPFLARITSIADTYDAMTSRRSYRGPLNLDFVIAEFEKNLGTQFDPELGKVFIEILKTEYSKIEAISEKYKLKNVDE